jgi:hypothetical protein
VSQCTSIKLQPHSPIRTTGLREVLNREVLIVVCGCVTQDAAGLPQNITRFASTFRRDRDWQCLETKSPRLALELTEKAGQVRTTGAITARKHDRCVTDHSPLSESALPSAADTGNSE